MSDYTKYPIDDSSLNNGFEAHHKKEMHTKDVYLHHHDFYEVYLLIEGELDYVVDGRKYKLNSGNILLIRPNQLHQPIFENLDQKYERYVFWISKNLLKSEKIYENISENSSYISSIASTEKSAIIALSDLLIYNQNTHKKSSSDIDNSIADLLLKIFERLFAETEPAKFQPIHTGLEAVIQYIDESIEKPINLDELTQVAFLTKYHLCRQFKQKIGVSIYQYSLKKKLLLANNLIKNNIPVTKVYSKCGFGNYSSFYRAFTKEYGMSPQQYMNSFKNKH